MRRFARRVYVVWEEAELLDPLVEASLPGGRGQGHHGQEDSGPPRRRLVRSRWTGGVSGKTFLQELNNPFERAHIFHIKRLVKHLVPIRGVHAAAAHCIQ